MKDGIDQGRGSVWQWLREAHLGGQGWTRSIAASRANWRALVGERLGHRCWLPPADLRSLRLEVQSLEVEWPVAALDAGLAATGLPKSCETIVLKVVLGRPLFLATWAGAVLEGKLVATDSARGIAAVSAGGA